MTESLRSAALADPAKGQAHQLLKQKLGQLRESIETTPTRINQKKSNKNIQNEKEDSKERTKKNEQGVEEGERQQPSSPGGPKSTKAHWATLYGKLKIEN